MWDDPLHLLTSYSFPSGHATGIAAAGGVVLVLSAMLVRRSSVRRAVTLAALAGRSPSSAPTGS